MIFYKDITYKNFDLRADIKIPLELSRFQHFTTLGKAFWITGDDKYAKEYILQVEDWIEKNPVKCGVNWFCAMDVAIRAVNWIWGFYFMRRSPEVSDQFIQKLIVSLAQHGRHIYNNLEKSENGSTNHFIADLVGLIYISVFLKGFDKSPTWYEHAKNEIIHEIELQVLPDGMDYEASTCYHRMVLEMFLSSALLCRINNDTWPENALRKIHDMFLFLRSVVKPNGKIPQVGDNDSGRIHKLQHLEDELDVSYLFPIAAVLFRDSRFKFPESPFSEESLWLLGPSVAAEYDRLDPGVGILDFGSFSFPDAGLYVLRNPSVYCMVSCGQNRMGGHAHNDKLGFELNILKEDFVTDPGTYIYSGNKEMRNFFRSSVNHSVVRINNAEINEIDESLLFRLKDNASARGSITVASDGSVIFKGSHSGYLKRFGVIHYREFLLELNSLSIKDIFDMNQERELELLHILIFAPTVAIIPVTARDEFPGNRHIEFDLQAKKKFVKLALNSTVPMETEICDTFYSPGYGVAVPSLKICTKIRCNGSFEMRSTFTLLN
jgi:hypothetical protein